MSIKKEIITVLPIVAGLTLIQVATPSHSSGMRKLTDVRFQTPSHNVEGQNISSTRNGRREVVTQLPLNMNNNLQVRFNLSFSGSSSGLSVANITPMTNASIVSCVSHSVGHANANKNVFGYCNAKKNELVDIDEETTVKIRFNSPGGGGNKYLHWKFKPSPTQNAIDSVITPGSILKGSTLSGDINLELPAAGKQTLAWGLYPKGCFSYASKMAPPWSSNTMLTGVVTFQAGEVTRSMNAITRSSCSAKSGVLKVWYADPGENYNTSKNPDKQRTFVLSTPRR